MGSSYTGHKGGKTRMLTVTSYDTSTWKVKSQAYPSLIYKTPTYISEKEDRYPF